MILGLRTEKVLKTVSMPELFAGEFPKVRSSQHTSGETLLI